MNRDEGGMALVEAILIGIVLIVPLVWLLGFLDHVHRAALGTSAAARAAGFAVASAPGSADAAEVEESVALALKDHDLGVDRAIVDVSVTGDGGRGSTVRVEVRYPVTMMDLPGLGQLPSAVVRARHAALVDPYRSR